MPLRVVAYQDTPNPNALRCTLSAQVATTPRSYRSLQHAGGDPLAAAILAIPGVCGLLLCENWLTVNRLPGTKWPPIKLALEAALAAHT